MNGFEGSIVSGLGDASTGLGQCLALAGPVTVGCSSNSSFDNFRASEFMLHHAVKHTWLHLSDSLLEAIIPIQSFSLWPEVQSFLERRPADAGVRNSLPKFGKYLQTQ